LPFARLPAPHHCTEEDHDGGPYWYVIQWTSPNAFLVWKRPFVEILLLK
jgi:hypothetical protein